MVIGKIVTFPQILHVPHEAQSHLSTSRPQVAPIVYNTLMLGCFISLIQFYCTKWNIEVRTHTR